MNHQQAYQIVRAKIPHDDAIDRRLEKAWSMIIGYGYEFKLMNPAYTHIRYWMVEKLSSSLMEDNGASYTVNDSECTCPDFESARGGLCKHRLAVMILTEMERGK